MKKALVVDDTKNIRFLLSQCLKNENFEVYSASCGDEAIELVRNNTFDIGFIDIKMPNMSGTAVLEKLIDDGYDFPIVIMTAFGTIKNAVTTTKLGAKAYLQKPFTANTIKKVLYDVLGDNFPSNEKVDNHSDTETNINMIISLFKNDPTNPYIYELISNYLVNIGDSNKAKLFSNFSNELKNEIR